MTVMSTPVEHSDFNFWSPQYHTTEKTRKQRWRSDESARLPPMLTCVWGLPQQEGSEKYKKSLILASGYKIWSGGFYSGPVPHVGWISCWLSPCCDCFSPGSPVFLPTGTLKTNISKFQFDEDGGPAWKQSNTDAASSMANMALWLYQFIFYLLLCDFRRGSKWHISVFIVTHVHLF